MIQIGYGPVKIFFQGLGRELALASTVTIKKRKFLAAAGVRAAKRSAFFVDYEDLLPSG